MRAALVDRYGPPDVVRIEDVARPDPGADAVLVRVHAAAVTSGDARVRGGRFPDGFGFFARLAFGWTGPRRKILGGTFAGVVESVGSSVGDLAPGDAVCGMAGMKMGAHAEYIAVPAKRVVRIPVGIGFDDAAGLLFGGTTALYFLRDKAKLAPSASLLVNGASGAVGTNAVQLGKHFGATVTAVTSSANEVLVRRLGADDVVLHDRVDLVSLDRRFDAVLDTVGNLDISSGRRLLTEGGVLLLTVASLGDTLRPRGNVKTGTSGERAEDFAFLLDLVATGTLSVVVDDAFDLDHIVDAYRRVDSGRKVGNVIVRP
ncbi:MAG: NAD(P)-dependent alcohol dehydrogenase [Acidimicrobiia bacterium]